MTTAESAAAWEGPGAARPRSRFTWNGLVWSFIYPQRGHRILPTIPGSVLIGLALGVGTAAYNSSSNILFITLSLLLACLILSGVLSWLNLRGVAWRLQLAPPLRAGHDTMVTLEVRNAKAFVPTYGLWFEFAVRAVQPAETQRAESTVTAKGIDVRAILAQAERAATRERLPLSRRLDPRGELRVEWPFKPERRGLLQVELASVGSLFPFGFLRKDIGTTLSAKAIVWPAPVEYRRHGVSAPRRTAGGERLARAGMGGELLALRRYATGDSHRLIHWKASARTRQLLVRQFAAESADGYSLWLRTEAGVWARPEQFELLVRFVASVAEDLFRAGRLLSVAIDGEAPAPMRRVRDLELFLDKLAVLRPAPNPVGGAAPTHPAGDGSRHPLPAKQHVMTFSPDGAHGVAAYVDERKAAST